MIVDSSAIIAIITAEPDAAVFAKAIAEARSARMSAANWLEASIVADGRGDPVVRREFDELIAQADIVVEAVTLEQARIAREAYRDFGRGSGHPAKLNFGDCFAYALAKDTGEPLLYKGNDFSHTDLPSAL
ncbi:type II toxin-antitoxin system VapC family toxin [Nonomuraea endophytica]|uniref:Ribonuclease VapC n=1 Tax=Nonomuraea endophytica TaxID=714136 RepID=A0A7W7ZWA5_9ACTN|nr:type II toxin-antitoxin system VapC family toxin [Nonomuraea endophytica]MBB5074674.1 ribonuclease VapC [Nonomuraea endophytica]